MRWRSFAEIPFGIAAMGAQKILSLSAAVPISRNCGATLAMADARQRDAARHAGAHQRDGAVGPAREFAKALEETIVVSGRDERLRARARAIHRQIHGQALIWLSGM